MKVKNCVWVVEAKSKNKKGWLIQEPSHSRLAARNNLKYYKSQYPDEIFRLTRYVSEREN